MSFSEADGAKQQHGSFLNGAVLKNKEKSEGFNSNNSCIDTFLAEFLARNVEFKWFWFVCKITFTLSHGQSQVERGSNVNKEILLEGGISQRSAYYIWSHWVWKHKFQDFKFTNELVKSCKVANQRYTIALEGNKLSVIENEKKVKRKLIDDEINDVKKRKLDLDTCVETLKKDANKFLWGWAEKWFDAINKSKLLSENHNWKSRIN